MGPGLGRPSISLDEGHRAAHGKSLRMALSVYQSREKPNALAMSAGSLVGGNLPLTYPGIA
jgi:hypothetical protein